MGRRKPKTLRVSAATKRRRRREKRVDYVEVKKKFSNVSDEKRRIKPELNKYSSYVDSSVNTGLRGSKRRHEESKATDLAKNLSMRTERTRSRKKRNSSDHSMSEARIVLVTHSEPNDVKSGESRKRRRRKKRRMKGGASACEVISDKGLEVKSRLKSIIVVPTIEKEIIGERTRMESDISACQVILEKGTEESLSNNILMPVVEKEICAVEGEASAVPRALRSRIRRKLLVLDLNGLLCDVVHGYPNTRIAHKRVGKSAVFKRPFCDDFMEFCCAKFDIGVWSSRLKKNVDGVVDFIMRNVRDTLLFCWDASQCTFTGFKTIEDRNKPLVLKQLKKLWNKEESDLPWGKGDYSPTNTLLLDDSPYKAICNPPHTGVFPHPFRYTDENDKSLGPGGNLRVYLEGLALACDVQSYVREHPFGRRAITNSSSSWKYYEQVINKIEKSSAKARGKLEDT